MDQAEVDRTRKLRITVTNDDGEVVYQTWNEDCGWKSVRLYLDEMDRPLDDARASVMGPTIGYSLWGMKTSAEEKRERDRALEPA